MRLTLRLLGREVLDLHLGPDAPSAAEPPRLHAAGPLAAVELGEQIDPRTTAFGFSTQEDFTRGR